MTEEDVVHDNKKKPAVSDRTRQRKKIVSKAYHQAFDLHKPKKSDVDYHKKLEKAKEAGRKAHAAAAKKFDAENPRRGPSKGSSSSKQATVVAVKATTQPEHDDGEEGGEEELPVATDPVVD